jgi:hypothetical protein
VAPGAIWVASILTEFGEPRMVTANVSTPIETFRDPVEPKSVVVKFRSSVDGSELCSPWDVVSAATLQGAMPWRTCRWHRGQKHYSGTYWSATQNAHVGYESRLELARLLLADFDTAVSHIVAQPFLLAAGVEGKQRKHIPDYFLITSDGPVVVDVKPRRHLTKPVVVRTFAWTRKAVESRGWRYEVWSEAAPFLLENVRFLAGYRRAGLFESGLIDRMSSSDLVGATVGEAIRKERAWPEMMVRAALMHLLWRQHFTVDLTRPLTPDHVLRSAA